MSEEIKKEEQTEVKEESVEEVKKEDIPEESNLDNKVKKKQYLIIAGIVGLITFVAVGGYFMMNKNNESIDYESCVTGLRNWTIQEGTKDPDYMKGVKWNKEYIKDVTVNDEQVKTDKQGTYEITYLIDIKDEKEKDIEKEYKVKVVSKEEAEKQTKDGKEVVTEEGIKNEKKTEKPKTEPTTQKEESNKKPSSNTEDKKTSKPSGGNTGSTEKPRPGHKHNWVEQFKTVHYEEKGHNEKVLVKEAWDEKVSNGFKCSCGATK